MKRRKTDKKASIGLAVAFIIFGATGIATTSMAGEASSSNTAAMAQEEFESDPWEPFNSKMFFFNHDILDQYILKPVAKGWNLVLPDVVQRSLRNVVDKTNVLPRLLNSLVQGKFAGAGREVARFTINSTVGLGGFLDIAKDGFGIDKSDEDTGQSLRFYGLGSGPYLVLPLFPPMTVRDGIGNVIDAAMNPINYLIPFAANADGGTTAGALVGIGFVMRSIVGHSILSVTKGSRRPWLISTVRYAALTSSNEKRRSRNNSNRFFKGC